mgnify:CR=1 FL=1
MKKILVVLHQSTSKTGLVGQVLRSFGYTLDIRIPSVGDELPTSMENHAAAIVFGGPMSANDGDTLPFIRQELDWIPTALDAQKPFLGICLGAQMLAKVLGGSVYSRPDGWVEIGYYPLYPTPKGQQELGNLRWVYYWHKEGFKLPTDAVRLARRDRFENQAFRYKNHAYGLQFHPEMHREAIKVLTARGAEQLSFRGAQPLAEQLQKYDLYGQQAASWLPGFLQTWLHSDRIAQQQLISS